MSFIVPNSFDNILLWLLKKVSNLPPILLNLLVLLTCSLPWTNNTNQFILKDSIMLFQSTANYIWFKSLFKPLLIGWWTKQKEEQKGYSFQFSNINQMHICCLCCIFTQNFIFPYDESMT